VFGPWIGGEVAESCGFRPAFFIGAAMLVLGALLVWRFVREDFVRPERSDKGRFASLMEVLGTTAFLAAIVSLFLVRFGNSSFQPVFPYLLREVLGTDEGLRALTGRIIGVAGLAAAVSAWFLSRVSDRWGHKRLLLVSIAVAGIATLGLAVARTIPHFYMLRALFGLAVAGIMPSASAIIRKVIHEKHLGKAYGIQASVTGLGWGIGSLSGGYVAAVWGLRAPFILTAVVLFVTIVFVARRVR